MNLDYTKGRNNGNSKKGVTNMRKKTKDYPDRVKIPGGWHYDPNNELKWYEMVIVTVVCFSMIFVIVALLGIGIGGALHAGHEAGVLF